jgi:hypothetical protein
MKTVIKPDVTPRQRYALEHLENGDEIRNWITRAEACLAPSPFDRNVPEIVYYYEPGLQENPHRFHIRCGLFKTIETGAEDDKPSDRPCYDICCALWTICAAWNTRVL